MLTTSSAWPPTPWRVDLPGAQDSLIFRTLGTVAHTRQTALFQTLLSTLLARLSSESWTYPTGTFFAVAPSLVDVPYYEAPLTFHLVLKPGIGVRSERYTAPVVELIRKETLARGTRSFSAELDAWPDKIGEVAMDLNPGVPIHRSVPPIFVSVPRAGGSSDGGDREGGDGGGAGISNHELQALIEIRQSDTRSYSGPTARRASTVLKDTTTKLSGLPSTQLFRNILVASSEDATLTFGLGASMAREQQAAEVFTNAVALSVVRALMAFFRGDEWKGVQFRVVMVVEGGGGGGRVVHVGNGWLMKRAGALDESDLGVVGEVGGGGNNETMTTEDDVAVA